MKATKSKSKKKKARKANWKKLAFETKQKTENCLLFFVKMKMIVIKKKKLF